MKVMRLINNLMVDDVVEAVDFYIENLGFELMMAVPEGTEEVVYSFEESVTYGFAALKHDDVEIMFQSKLSVKEEFPDMPECTAWCPSILYFQITDIEGLFEKLRDRVDIVKGLHEAFYGMKEFYMKDSNGYMLGFAEKA